MKPLNPPPSKVEISAGAQPDYRWLNWFNSLFSRLRDGPFEITGYAVADLPDAALWSDASAFSALVFVNDETGGATLAFSDGTDWRRVTDRAIVS